MSSVRGCSPRGCRRGPGRRRAVHSLDFGAPTWPCDWRQAPVSERREEDLPSLTRQIQQFPRAVRSGHQDAVAQEPRRARERMHCWAALRRGRPGFRASRRSPVQLDIINVDERSARIFDAHLAVEGHTGLNDEEVELVQRSRSLHACHVHFPELVASSQPLPGEPGPEPGDLPVREQNNEPVIAPIGFLRRLSAFLRAYRNELIRGPVAVEVAGQAADRRSIAGAIVPTRVVPGKTSEEHLGLELLSDARSERVRGRRIGGSATSRRRGGGDRRRKSDRDQQAAREHSFVPCSS